jgi:hypothetical protein
MWTDDFHPKHTSNTYEALKVLLKYHMHPVGIRTDDLHPKSVLTIFFYVCLVQIYIVVLHLKLHLQMHNSIAMSF